MVRLPLG